ncbi:MAG: PAS domain-containing sensor histidine kinase [Bacteroidetes bacterium]|nr:PAS domain-containing sensor histidine kinase [Bacteroidota bacterium]
MTLRLFRNEEELSRSRDVRFHSWQLSDELRQSSDDLTRMARTYAATGNPEYERQYWTVLGIRNGKCPRPLNYNQIYWDFVIAPGQKPREDGEAISLHDLMIREGFTTAEFNKLTEAQKNSDELVNVERIAMNAVKGLYADNNGNFTVKKKPDRELAIRLMNDKAYHITKANIMKPIDEFYVMFIKRTTLDVVTNERHSKNLLVGIITLILLIMGIFAFSFVMILRQIGMREQAEDTLRESEARFRDIIFSSSDWIWEIDQHWNYCYSSANIDKILGYSVNEILGKSPFDLMTGEEKEHSGPYFQNIVKTKGVIKDLENWNLHKDGHKVCLLTNGFPIIDKTGRLTGFRGVDKDITGRKLSEEALLESEEKYRDLIETMTDGVYRSSHEGKFLEVNQAMVNILGYDSREELKAIDIKSQLYFAEEDRESAALEEKLEEMAVFRLRKKDGSEIWVEDHGRHVLNDIGAILYHEGTLRDVTERKKAEDEITLKNEQLQLINAEKDKFFSIIAHDLRSPFSSLLGFSQMLVEELPALKPEEIQKIAQSIRRTTTNLYSLLVNLLEWSRLQRDMISFNPESFPLRHKITETMELLMESANKKKISVSYDIPADLELYADTTMFEAIIRNLASNAIKFTRENGEVSIIAKSAPDLSVKISVSDTGIGMNQEMISNLFRLDEKTNRKGTDHEPSTGLGLIICREFIEKHSGELRIESQEEKGSTITITFPPHYR